MLKEHVIPLESFLPDEASANDERIVGQFGQGAFEAILSRAQTNAEFVGCCVATPYL
jgi:hypothetical protein